MSETQRQIIQECFDGDRERDCDYCPAHYSKNGKCCFGSQFDEDDDRCMSCNHNYHCSIETQAKEQVMERPRRIMINRGRSGQSSGGSRLPIFGQRPQPQPSPQPSYRPVRSPVRPQVQPRTEERGSLLASNQELNQHMREWGTPGELPQGTGALPEPVAPMNGFWKNMGLHAAWGAGEGLLEMLLGFMRTRRPL